MRILSLVLRFTLFSAFACVLSAQTSRADFSLPFPPHKIIGNVYFVGSSNLTSLLITTPQGHILINTDFEETVPLIRKNIEQLGFKMSDVKIILGSHAHGDHMEGDAAMKELTGARVMALDRDVPALEKMMPGGKKHPIDQVLHDGEEVKLGGVVLKAHLTAGHTKGCTTWTMKAQEGGKSYDVVMVCSVGVNPGFILVNNKDYPSIADDYVRSFATLRALPCDVFLGAHDQFYNLDEKYKKLQSMKKGDPNPFIDHAGYLAYIDQKEKEFNEKLAEQKK